MVAKIIITTAAMAGISGILSLILIIAERYLANYGECKIVINDEKELNVIGGSSLLSTLSGQKIFLPSACGGRGTCGYCKCQVLEGVGPILPTEEPLLTKQEIENNVRLACQVKVKQDVKIKIPEELFNIKEFRADVVLMKDLTYDIKLVRLKLIEPKEIKFKAGQYIQLYSKPYEQVKESVSRAYSIASPSSETDHVDLMIRLVPEGMLTTWLFHHLHQGDEVKMIAPMGDFRLHDGEGEMIFIAGGSGMAPMVSLLHEIKQRNMERKVTFFFGANTQADLFFTDEMKAFEESLPNFKFVPTISQPAPEDEWKGATGLITEPVEKHLKTSECANSQAYLCGSPGMIKACVNVLKTCGISNDNIFFDPFA